MQNKKKIANKTSIQLLLSFAYCSKHYSFTTLLRECVRCWIVSVCWLSPIPLRLPLFALHIFWLGSFSISLLSMFLFGSFMLSLNLVRLAHVYYIAMDFISILHRLQYFFFHMQLVLVSYFVVVC